MVKNIIIDASVIVKWFIDENDSDKAEIIKEQFINEKINIIIPALLNFEVLSALKYSKLFNLEELNSVGESIENYGFNIIMIRDEIREKMIEFAINHDISIYDASYLALAEKFKTQLITADEKIIKKLPKNLKLLILNLKNYNKD
ncbi:type II toxin-antitoxin system VapC family toxin [Promethearchaeum syntrophicum]|uniref:Type II toxin-antitoxin system VapC family toxin n=1 Tax=Promethearchaeum syntrophicum TaxID=2594042 RepID=A0A5B9DBD6_9ARCH|nr:type II toxin-antitoxin system VapC family toxin [Candidatus Prometheoarchaeum syntrophicum]QEE16157.1 Ribonuclease VapC3 [Candidatus Prometheoarchaeum syntrophicum]